MAELSEGAKALFTGRNYAFLATVMPKGWRVDVRGRVVDWIVGDEAERHIDALSSATTTSTRTRATAPMHRASSP